MYSTDFSQKSNLFQLINFLIYKFFTLFRNCIFIHPLHHTISCRIIHSDIYGFLSDSIKKEGLLGLLLKDKRTEHKQIQDNDDYSHQHQHLYH